MISSVRLALVAIATASLTFAGVMQAQAQPVPAYIPAQPAVTMQLDSAMLPATTVLPELAAPVLHVTPHVSKAYFSWAAVIGASVYELKVSPAGSGATTRYDHVTSARGITVALHPGRYVASVRAGRSFSDVHGHWALARYFTVAAPAPVYSSLAAKALAWAYLQQGKWYAWGGTGPSTFDCSGLVMMAYEHAGIQLPRTTYEMLASSRLHRTYSPQPGDLAFYGSGHVELYVRAGVTFGAHQSGERIGLAYYSGSWQPTMFFRVA